MKLIIGLGNPGKDYEKTRHNAGFLAIDTIARALKIHDTGSFDKKSNSELIPITINDEKILLVKPQTFMNSSGEAVRKLMDFYKLQPQDIIIIHDEKDLPLGEYREQTNRGAAGHNGVLSVIAHLGTKDFKRIRIGVGPHAGGIPKIVDYVLEKFSKEELKLLQTVLNEIAEKLTTDPPLV